MNDILAAAFGIAGNQIHGVLLELFEAYNNLTKAGVKLSPDDKLKFDTEVRKVKELAQFLFDIEFGAAVDRVMNEQEQRAKR